MRDFVATAHGQPVTALAFSADGLLAASASGDGAVRFWDVVTGQVLQTVALTGTLDDSRSYVIFSCDGRLVAAANRGGPVALWQFEDGRLIGSFSAPPGVSGLALSPDGQTLVIANMRNRDVRRVDARSGQEQWRHLHAKVGSLHSSIAISPDGRWVAAGDSFGWIQILDAVTGRLLGTVEAHRAGVSCLQYSLDGTVLYSASHDGRVGIWHAGELLPDQS